MKNWWYILVELGTFASGCATFLVTFAWLIGSWYAEYFLDFSPVIGMLAMFAIFATLFKITEYVASRSN
jgi:hypothetical protein